MKFTLTLTALLALFAGTVSLSQPVSAKDEAADAAKMQAKAQSEASKAANDQAKAQSQSAQGHSFRAGRKAKKRPRTNRKRSPMKTKPRPTLKQRAKANSRIGSEKGLINLSAFLLNRTHQQLIFLSDVDCQVGAVEASHVHRVGHFDSSFWLSLSKPDACRHLSDN